MSRTSDHARALEDMQAVLASIRDAIQAHSRERQDGADDVMAARAPLAPGALSAEPAGSIAAAGQDADVRPVALPDDAASAVDDLLETDHALEWVVRDGESFPGARHAQDAMAKSGLSDDETSSVASPAEEMPREVLPGRNNASAQGMARHSADMEVQWAGQELQQDHAEGELSSQHAAALLPENRHAVSGTASVVDAEAGDAVIRKSAARPARRSVVSPLFPVAGNAADIAPAATDRHSPAADSVLAAAPGEAGAGGKVSASGARVVAMPAATTGAGRLPTDIGQADAAVPDASVSVDGALALQSQPSSGESAKVHSLLSEKARRKVRSALDRLDRLEQAKVALGGEEALRQLVSDLLEPMLARWLDENLPDIVERRVAQEIARLREG